MDDLSVRGGHPTGDYSMAVHGGAFAIAPDEAAPLRDGCVRALRAGLDVLVRGGSSLDAVQRAIAVLEDDPVFDAGTGAFLNEEGEVELDAAIMDGSGLRTGAVASVRRVRNPIGAARAVLDGPHAFLVGPGAEAFAAARGVELCDPRELVVDRELLRWRELRDVDGSEVLASYFGDTVGAVARDAHGHVAAGTSTGGTPGKPPGRVGDTPQVGSGLYADDVAGGVSVTGHGELIIPLVWSKSVVDLMARGMPAPDAAHEGVALLARLDARAGLVTVDARGRVGAAWNTPGMAFAYQEGARGETVAGPVDRAGN